MERDADIQREVGDGEIAEPAVNGEGVDLSLVRRSLDMSTLERLTLVQGWARAILRAKVIGERP